MTQLELILASSSRYRKVLLQRLQLPFTCMSPDLDEETYHERITDPVELTLTLASEKSRIIYEQHSQAVVIGSDQVVSFDGKILGKPLTVNHAITQLLQLKSKTHQLITACSIRSGTDNITFVNLTELTMRDLSTKEIESYIKHDDPLHCAGSYKIESLGISLFSSICTEDFTAITGLPLLKLAETLRKLGFSIP